MTEATYKPIIFISYAHLDEPEKPSEGEVKWLTYVQSFLRPALTSGIFDIWVDRLMPGGTLWDAEIENYLRACDIFVLLASRHSLSSTYIIDTEIKTVRDRQAKGEAVHVYPLLLSATPDAALEKIKAFNIRPRDLKPLNSYRGHDRDQHVVEAADEIAKIAAKIAARKKPPAGTGSPTSPPPSVMPAPVAGIYVGTTDERLQEKQSGSTWVAGTEPGQDGKGGGKTLAPTHVHISGLPETAYENLVGRGMELARLDAAWADPKINVLSLVAEGGAGKSALVNEWLKRMRAENYRGAETVLGWSFYSQGTKERATSADSFLDWAVEKLGAAPKANSGPAKGEAIAEAMMRRRALLVLDGVEPLQHGPDGQQGLLKDPGLRELLRRFAATPPAEPHGLIVLTSRLAVADVARSKESAPVVDVESLSDEAGAALLRDNGVWGTSTQLKTAARDFGGHPLALGLLASYLKETKNGDVRRRDHLRGLLADAENPGHDHARRVMESYEKECLAGQPVLLVILHLVGLFDRPASGDCLAALRAKPVIAGLTEPIVDLGDDDWNRAVARLREARLLTPPDPHAPEALDAHPLVREWFGERLHKTNESAWKAAQGRLYEHLRDTTQEGKTPTLADLAPLYQAIPHGCRAGRHQEALDKIYKNRICRRRADGRIEFYSRKKLGAFGSNLAAISWFFVAPYATPVAALSAADRSWVLGEASMALSAQGRIAEALPAMRAGLKMYADSSDWRNAAIAASNLSQTELLFGAVAAAVADAQHSVEYADRSGDEFQIVVNRTTHADALHAAGRPDEAALLFADAEQRQQKQQPGYPRLYSLRGYQYCDLLLSQGEPAAARHRATKVLEWEVESDSLLDRGLVRLTLARADLALASNAAAGQPPTAAPADGRALAAAFDHAVEGLRTSGQNDDLPRGLLARAAYFRGSGDWAAAARDLDEVLEIAEPGAMKLFLCDRALERARLALARLEAFAPLNPLVENPPPPPALPDAETAARLRDEAEADIYAAKKLIEECGYHKRDEELAELRDVLAGRRKFAELPPRV
jgi:hypothetical protein